MAMYFEATREKMFPLTMIVALLISAVAIFVFVNALTNVIVNTQDYIARNQSSLFYWLRFKLPLGDLSAYASDVNPPAGNARSIPILVYHGESDLAGNTPLHVFVDHMRALKRDGWRTITMADFRAFMKEGKQLPEKSFLLTFDDGRKDTYYPSDPVLKDMGFTGVMFTVTGYSLPESGKPASFYLDKHELQYMIDSGRWEIQSHGDMSHHIYHVQSTTDLSLEAETVDGHFLTNRFWNEEANRFETDEEFAERIRKDLIDAKNILEKSFGLPIDSFAYPFSDFGIESVNFRGSERIILDVVPTIYSFAFYQTWPANGDSFNYPDPQEFKIKRIVPHADWSGDDLLDVLNSARAKELPYESNSFGKEWVSIWGAVERQADALSIAASPQTSGSTAFLNGSGWWTNYSFEASVDWIAGESVSVLARNEDDLNYLSCAFTDGAVRLIRKSPDGEFPIARSSADTSGARNGMRLGITVHGSSASCLLNGAVVVSGSFAGLRKGGIGVEVWDSTHGTAHSKVNSVSVVPR